MAMPPQAAMNAPSGPRNPQILTDASRSGAARPRVVERIRYAQAMPARMPHRWMQICAGVQKLSRPMERCQEISHWMPTMAQVTAATLAQTCQGMWRVTGDGESADVAAMVETLAVIEL